jgi:hypothetical protein
MEIKERINPETDMANRNPKGIFIESPFQQGDIKPVNGNHAAIENENEEDDLILGNEDELEGDEEEYDIELEEDFDEDELNEDDLVLDADDDIDEDKDEDL